MTAGASYNPAERRDHDGKWTDGASGAVGDALKLMLRGSGGTVHAEIGDDGGLQLRFPFDGSGEPGTDDTIRLDPGATGDLGEELGMLAEARGAYVKRAQKAWDATERAKPGTPEHTAAQDAWFKIGGDGQRIAGGELDGDGGALVYEMRMGDEVTDTQFLIGIRPEGADTDEWDLHEATGQAAAQYLPMAAFRRLRKFLGSTPGNGGVGG